LPDSTAAFHRILYLTFAAFPSRTAHSVNIIKMCEALSKSGYKVTLAADARKTEKDIFDFYNIKSPFEIKKIKLVNIRFLGRLSFLIKAYFFVRKNCPDLLYTRDIFSAFFAKILRVPFIWEIHEAPNTFFRKALMKQTLISRNLVVLVFISQRLKNLMTYEMQSLLEEKKFIIAPDGVDLTDFDLKLTQSDARKALDLPENAFIAGYTGSLFEGRGVEIILKLGSALKDIAFVVVGGEGKHLDAFNRKVKNLKLNNVIAKGFVPHRLIPLYLRAFDMLLMPYQTKVLHRQKKHDTADYMSPLKMFEFMASGRPIIASRMQVLEEILQDKVSALFVRSEDLDGWINAVMFLKKNKEVARELGKKAKENVRKYTWDQRTKNISESIL
jgi:glycosyltransferase involved in cell wall biosynthesis